MKPLSFHRWFPRRSWTRAVGCFARHPASRWAIPLFVRIYRVDASEAEKPLGEYRTLSEFFGRRLRPGARVIDADAGTVVSPCDGKLSAQGMIREDTLIQAKNIAYPLDRLLGGDQDRAAAFHNGRFMTLYLSPQGYHRVHAPATGEVVSWTHIPGTFYPVNARGVREIPALFTRNERVITYLKTAYGLVAIVLVGALVVGGITVDFAPECVSNRRPMTVRARDLATPWPLQLGEEFGRFDVGSTVILLFPPGSLDEGTCVAHASSVRVGTPIARWEGGGHDTRTV